VPEDQWPDGSPCSHCLWFSNEADDAVAEFEQWIEPQLALGGVLGSMAGWSGKLVGQSARIASLLHFGAGRDRHYPVEEESVSRAREIALYLIPHARAAFQAMGTDPAVNGAREILEWLKKNGPASFTKRDAFNGLRSAFARAAEMDEPLSILMEHGYIRQEFRERQPGAGRPPSPAFEVHPSLVMR
jgi:replicative DNA helicase